MRTNIKRQMSKLRAKQIRKKRLNRMKKETANIISRQTWMIFLPTYRLRAIFKKETQMQINNKRIRLRNQHTVPC